METFREVDLKIHQRDRQRNSIFHFSNYRIRGNFKLSHFATKSKRITFSMPLIYPDKTKNPRRRVRSQVKKISDELKFCLILNTKGFKISVFQCQSLTLIKESPWCKEIIIKVKNNNKKRKKNLNSPEEGIHVAVEESMRRVIKDFSSTRRRTLKKFRGGGRVQPAINPSY